MFHPYSVPMDKRPEQWDTFYLEGLKKASPDRMPDGTLLGEDEGLKVYLREVEDFKQEARLNLGGQKLPFDVKALEIWGLDTQSRCVSAMYLFIYTFKKKPPAPREFLRISDAANQELSIIASRVLQLNEREGLTLKTGMLLAARVLEVEKTQRGQGYAARTARLASTGLLEMNEWKELKSKLYAVIMDPDKTHCETDDATGMKLLKENLKLIPAKPKVYETGHLPSLEPLAGGGGFPMPGMEHLFR